MGLANLSIKPILSEGGEPLTNQVTVTIDGMEIGHAIRSIFVEKIAGRPTIVGIELIANVEIDELPIEIQEAYSHVPGSEDDTAEKT